ncbi:TIGR02449 family protein [Pseudomonas oryzae]|uniref:Cell division protein ZapB n=1 Tax=Pseudomonas oryzae TaxID=1392877 RepID=A0A1H1X532_9PSED|nr:TIGR02449 family protein [Pseudomonas oryzae]SDT04404.1 cell division protein ZapB [Pseudomonas oryzae]
MEDPDLDLLTARIDQLIQLNERLRTENRRLRDSERHWREERARLVEQNELARHTVESMISRLKALEQDS